MGGGAVSTEAILQGGDGTPLRCNRSENIFAVVGMDVCAGGHRLDVMKKYKVKFRVNRCRDKDLWKGTALAVP